MTCGLFTTSFWNRECIALLLFLLVKKQILPQKVSAGYNKDTCVEYEIPLHKETTPKEIAPITEANY